MYIVRMLKMSVACNNTILDILKISWQGTHMYVNRKSYTFKRRWTDTIFFFYDFLNINQKFNCLKGNYFHFCNLIGEVNLL